MQLQNDDVMVACLFRATTQVLIDVAVHIYR